MTTPIENRVSTVEKVLGVKVGELAKDGTIPNNLTMLKAIETLEGGVS